MSPKLILARLNVTGLLISGSVGSVFLLIGAVERDSAPGLLAECILLAMAPVVAFCLISSWASWIMGQGFKFHLRMKEEV